MRATVGQSLKCESISTHSYPEINIFFSQREKSGVKLKIEFFLVGAVIKKYLWRSEARLARAGFPDLS
jgi:hypothetical protein